MRGTMGDAVPRDLSPSNCTSRFSGPGIPRLIVAFVLSGLIVAYLGGPAKRGRGRPKRPDKRDRYGQDTNETDLNDDGDGRTRGRRM
jgi:hypothetical protein